MAYLDNALQQLLNERRQAHLHVERLDSAISVLKDCVAFPEFVD
jgi:hypothetical protein